MAKARADLEDRSASLGVTDEACEETSHVLKSLENRRPEVVNAMTESKRTSVPLDPSDGLVAAADFHRIVFENDRVRVLEVTIPPKTCEPYHTHALPAVFIFEELPEIRYYDENGTLVERGKREIHQPYWMEPQGLHAVENLDEDLWLRAIRIELKR